MISDSYEEMPKLDTPADPKEKRVSLLEKLVMREELLFDEIGTLKESLALKEAEYKDLLQSRIPDAVRADDPMVSEVTLDDGTKIELEDQCHITYAKSDEPLVYDFVIQRGNEKLLQYIFSVKCGKGTHQEAAAIQNFLSKFKGHENVEISGQRYINPISLKATLRKLRKEVALLPCCKVFAPTVASITRVINPTTKGDIFG